MRGITLSTDEIDAAPPEVRRWLEQEIAGIAGWLKASEPAMLAAGLSTFSCSIITIREGMTKIDGETAEDIHSRIAARAYELWESEGHRHGRDLTHWLQAEREIMSRLEDRESPVPSEARPTP